MCTVPKLFITNMITLMMSVHNTLRLTLYLNFPLLFIAIFFFFLKICIRLMQSQNQVTHSRSFYSVLLCCTQLTGR